MEDKFKKIVPEFTSSVAAMVGYMTAILTGAAVTVNQFIDISNTVFPQSSIKIISFALADGITLANTGDGKIFVSDLVYEIPGRGEGTVEIDKVINPSDIITHNFESFNYSAQTQFLEMGFGGLYLTKEYLVLLRRSFINYEMLNINVIFSYLSNNFHYGDGLKGPTEDINLCISSRLTYKDDGEFKLVERNLGDRLHFQKLHLSLDATDLNTGEKISHKNIDGFQDEAGRIVYFFELETCRFDKDEN